MPYLWGLYIKEREYRKLSGITGTQAEWLNQAVWPFNVLWLGLRRGIVLFHGQEKTIPSTRMDDVFRCHTPP